MSKKLKQLERIKINRGRLRDIAAIEAAAMDVRRQRSLARLSATADLLADTIDAASDRFAEADSASDLIAYEHEVSSVKTVVRDAEADCAKAHKQAEHATERLRARERDLRATEKLVERVRKAQTLQTDRAEQRLNDDISAAKMRRIA
jgi:flagellar export protein FliJ